MNPNTSILELLWNLAALLTMVTAVSNYWNAASDTREMVQRGINGHVALAARDERQAELFRILVAICFLCGGLVASSIPGVPVPPGEQFGPGAYAQFLLIVGAVATGLSSLRARINRKVAINTSLRDPPHA